MTYKEQFFSLFHNTTKLVDFKQPSILFWFRGDMTPDSILRQILLSQTNVHLYNIQAWNIGFLWRIFKKHVHREN